MKNKKLGQEPIIPTLFRQIDENQLRIATEKDKNDSYAILKQTEGMSKRFYAACAAMQGFISNSETDPDAIQEIIQESYKFADELLSQENL